MPAIALTIAGSDPSGGAGIQADLKTFHQFGVYGEAVVTLITVQNTQGVSRVQTLPPDLVIQQIDAVISDIRPGAAKTGALGSVEIVEAVAGLAKSFRFPLVVDPVMVSKHGVPLISPEAQQALKQKLLPHAFLVTPNTPEAEALTGMAVRSMEEMQAAGERLVELGAKAALIKGGHREGEPIDVLVTAGDAVIYPGRRINTPHTHGTGCTYSAAIAANLALAFDLNQSVQHAKDFIQLAIEKAPALGRGQGPVNHFVEVIAD
ncbi:MAG: bifunctional hydroxymethylpyrimidine kinase/phosphomethylpyrimidine kinase [Acidobacteriaceae bacterium]|nr:bifunctional hydroxymethylpyrimidine kinase/phosphomethylpyrimidine kinase [Acidobacteriaceae bacterium]